MSASSHVATSRHAQEMAPWLEKAARLGYAAKGSVYGLIGALAIMWAVGLGGGAADQREALALIAKQPFGVALLIAIGVGLVGYGIWRFVEAGFNFEGYKPVKRIALVFSGLGYGALGVFALSLVAGQPLAAGGGDNSSQERTAEAMSLPGGSWLVMAVGAILIIAGIVQFVNAFMANFKKVLKMGEMSPEQRQTAVAAGRLGLTARGVVFTLTGGFILYAGLTGDPNKAKGFEGVLKTLAEAPYGPYLLGAIGIGLLAYAVYQFVEAKYRRMAVPEGIKQQ